MAGCLVVAFSLSPEARQLIDEVPSVYVLRMSCSRLCLE